MIAVSVIIIGRNEGRRLIRCIESVKAMNFPQDRLEIIYVDSNSSDDSVAQANALGAQTLLVPPGPTTAALGRNTGLEVARGTYVFFLDGDTIVDPDFLTKAMTFLEEHSDYVGVCGDRREIAPEESIYNRLLDLDWNGPPGDVAFFGGDAVARRQALIDVGGYKEDLIAGEEPQLCHRLRAKGYKIMHLDIPMTGHDLALRNFKGYWLRCYRAGHAYAEVAELTQGETFGKESKRNLIQGAAYLIMPILLLILLQLWALPLMAIGSALVWARTVWRSRWRKTDLNTLCIYALHSHICQFPIFFGQLKYFRNRKAKVAGRIIEYK